MPNLLILSAPRPAHVASDRGESTTIPISTTLVTGKMHLVDAIVIGIIMINNTTLGPESATPSHRNCVPTSSMTVERSQHLLGVMYPVSLLFSLYLYFLRVSIFPGMSFSRPSTILQHSFLESRYCLMIIPSPD